MERLQGRYFAAGLLTLLVAWPLWAQKTGSGGSSGGSTGGGSSTSVPTQPRSSSQPTSPRFQTPVYVNGRVLMDSGQPVPEPVSVGLTCGMTSVQTIHTDSKGYFQFTLGAGMQGNQDITASDTPMQTMPNGTSSPGDFGGMTGMSGMGGFGGMGSPGSSLVGCELRVSVSGYRPIEKTITDSGDIGQIDAGTLQLQRIEGAQGSSISVTSLQVPEKARKEFEKGDKELHSKHLDAATEHLEKAVADYDKYAVAWTELGQIYTAKQKPEMAQKAFTKAIDSDPKYIPPFVALAALDLQTEKYESAAEFAGKALELDPRIGLASYVEALADFKLNKLDDAEKSALAAEKQPHQNIPQVHVLLANIFLQKEDESKAAAQMRAYLKEAPQGNFAPQVKDSLAQIEESAGKDGADTAQEQIAP